jgi:hypothetical protein
VFVGVGGGKGEVMFFNLCIGLNSWLSDGVFSHIGTRQITNTFKFFLQETWVPFHSQGTENTHICYSVKPRPCVR